MAFNKCELAKKLYDALGDVIGSMDCNCNCTNSDGITLPFGKHEIIVQTDNTPSEVYVSLNDSDLPVCQGDLSTSSVSLQQDGFTLYVDIKSNEGVVKWIVKHD